MDPISKVGAPSDNDDDAVVVPLIAESLQVDVHQVSRGGVRVHREVRDEPVTVDPPLRQTHVDIERRTVNQLVDGPAPEPYQDGDTLVIPVVEEIAVIHRRWLLKEELRITRSEHAVRRPQEVILRRDHVTVERFSDAGDTAHAGPPHPNHRKETR